MSIVSDSQPTTKANVGQSRGDLYDTVLTVLALSGIDGATLQHARQVLATGYVYDVWARAVNELGLEDLKPVAAINAEVIKRITEQKPIKPLVDLIEKQQAAQVYAEPGHFPWCRTGDCATRHFEDGEPYVSHVGPKIDMTVPAEMSCRNDQLLSAELVALEEFSGTPTVTFNSGGNGICLEAAELDTVISDLDTFLDGLRAMRRQLDQEKAK
ncbi:hypothetical protein EAO71_20395 [Streptomyces sp. ms191]|uniref:DUF6907 domain-containing protein n=1 Tax=Streptomyces sp. ms191 TaxID=1827978 RepID=UPI0011CE16CA|nr:hypothetical protein [Streptomyces sp. ms191]TXS30756.1 hypothetical protein EAO71_20395 [Streptomyces sp. ms191]